MRYLFLILALFTFIAPVNEVEAGNTVSVNRGEAMKTLSWVVANAPSCLPDADYPSGNGDGIYNRWTSAARGGNGSETFTSPVLYVNEPISGTFEDYNFWCTAGAASDTSTLRICNNTTHRSDGGSSCVAIPSYTITFDGNGSTGGSMGAQSIVSGASANLTANAFSRPGYNFAGWATTPAGAVAYANGASYTMGSSNVTLYAKWNALTYAVTYNANSATSGVAPANQTKTHDVNLSLALNSGSLARTNFFFAGWNTAANGAGTDYAVGANYSTNAILNLFAKWVANLPPVANAGSDDYITLPQSSTNPIGASASDPDGSVASILWTVVGTPPTVPTITSANTISPTFSNMTVDGTYTFNLRVQDNSGAVSNDTVDIVVDPAPAFICMGALPPFASFYAGDDTGLAVNTPSMYSAVNNPPKCEYTCNPGYYYFAGSCQLPDIMAMNVSPVPASTFTASDITFDGRVRNMKNFAIPEAGWADVEIDWYSDGLGIVNINAFGGSQVGPLGAMGPGGERNLSVTLLAGSIPVGNHRYRFNVDTDGTALAEDNEFNNRSMWSSFTVNAANVAPTANAGPDDSITLPDTDVSVSGIMSNDTDGFINGWLWTEVSRPGGAPAALIVNDNLSSTEIQNLTTVGNYVFNLRVTDDDGAIGNDTVTITVAPSPNTPPTANAGMDRDITPPVDFTNTMGASAWDAEGLASTIWTIVSNPPASAPAITDASTMNPTFTNLTVPGNYTFRLEVTDSDMVMVSDEMEVVVQPIPPAVCTGVLPGNASVYAGDQLGFMGDLPLTYSAVDTGAKCEFSCDLGFWWNGGSCELPDLSVVNNGPANGASLDSDVAINFTGTVSNSASAPITQGGWAGLEVDWDSDGSYDYYDVTGGVELGAFLNPESRGISYNYPAPIPLGSHQYRFNVDSTGTFGESDEANNVSAWRSFSVSVPTPPPPGSQPPVGNPPVSAAPGACGGRINVAWGASAFADTYEISLDGGGSWPMAYRGIAGLSHTISGLPVNTLYNNIVVRARNTSGPSLASSPAASATASDYCEVLNVSSCPSGYIENGDATCAGNVVNWDITGATPATANITRMLPLPVLGLLDPATPVGGPLPITLYHGTNNIAARDNNVIVQDRTLNITCRPESFFYTNGTGVCEPRPILISPAAPVIRSGKTASLTFRVRASYPLDCTFSNGMALGSDFSYPGTGAEIPYTALTVPLTSGQVIEMSCNTPTGDIVPPATTEVRVNVIPNPYEN